MNNNYKIVLIGDGGVGKTTYIKRVLTGEFEKKYLATVGVEISTYNLNTTYDGITSNMISFNIWDTAGQEKFGGLRVGYWIGADAFILMFDLTSKSSFRSIYNYIRDLNRESFYKNKPIIVCGNKCDLKEKRVDSLCIKKLMDTLSSITDKYKYFDLSAKSNYNFEKPFLNLARYFTKH